ncbi:MAG: signal recognition particle-docking protein FtsY [Alphaproteobacteria bacterium]|nr:signal recognition particle-docking protein FtsY [Alphaproteobacteria bacterium]
MGIFSKISSFFTGKKELDTVTAESLSDALIAADIAPGLAESLVSKLRARGTIDAAEAKQILFDAMLPTAEKVGGRRLEVGGKDNNIQPQTSYLLPPTSKSPLVILIIGVNGAGKTTTIGKLARQWTDAGKKVIIGACDTFRAAAGEQLEVWAERAGAKIICGKSNDPAATAYAAIQDGIDNHADIVILDTAGRLHNRADLMDELAKVTRVIKKIIPDAPHETLLVLDAMTGQNATAQIEYFDKVAPLTALIVTKMDSTSKGGFLITYASNTKKPLPIAAIGYGEKIGDLRPFDAGEYLKKLLDL